MHVFMYVGLYCIHQSALELICHNLLHQMFKSLNETADLGFSCFGGGLSQRIYEISLVLLNYLDEALNRECTMDYNAAKFRRVFRCMTCCATLLLCVFFSKLMIFQIARAYCELGRSHEVMDKIAYNFNTAPLLMGRALVPAFLVYTTTKTIGMDSVLCMFVVLLAPDKRNVVKVGT